MSAHFPRLSTLMNAWLNQDYDIDGDDDRAVVDAYARATSAADLVAAIAELDALLVLPTAGLLDRFVAETGFGNMLIADDDTGARLWLSEVRARLAGHAARLPPGGRA